VQIDRKMNLVIPVFSGGRTFYVHSVPISREVFEQNFVLLSRTLTTLYAGGATPMNARLAMLYLRKTASEMIGPGESPDPLVTPITHEMNRLSSVLVPSAAGYEVLPWQQAIDRKTFDDEDAREVESILCFFTLAWHMHKKAELGGLVELLVGLGAQEVTSLTPTAFAASLTTSTEDATSAPRTTGPAEARSSHPS
jgi:hypothetical protein